MKLKKRKMDVDYKNKMEEVFDRYQLPQEWYLDKAIVLDNVPIPHRVVQLVLDYSKNYIVDEAKHKFFTDFNFRERCLRDALFMPQKDGKGILENAEDIARFLLNTKTTDENGRN